jgi:hypothetical protein
VQPLQSILADLEELIKRTVIAHKEATSGKWANLHQRLESRTTLSVYCDCSVIAGRFHFGVCIAGLQTCKLFGCSNNTRSPQHTVLGEIRALEFTIQCVERTISTSECDAIKSIAVFSDVADIHRLLHSDAQRLHPPVLDASRRLNQQMTRFSETYPGIRLRIYFLGNCAQRSNLYYRTAHKVARIAARTDARTT